MKNGSHFGYVFGFHFGSFFVWPGSGWLGCAGPGLAGAGLGEAGTHVDWANMGLGLLEPALHLKCTICTAPVLYLDWIKHDLCGCVWNLHWICIGPFLNLNWSYSDSTGAAR